MFGRSTNTAFVHTASNHHNKYFFPQRPTPPVTMAAAGTSYLHQPLSYIPQNNQNKMQAAAHHYNSADNRGSPSGSQHTATSPVVFGKSANSAFAQTAPKNQNNNYAGSKCYDAPDPKTLPRPPSHWISKANDEAKSSVSTPIQVAVAAP